jgi:hypothetical protein
MKKCLLGLLCLFISIQSFSQSLESDRLALVAIYVATSTGINDVYGSPNFNDITGWNIPGASGDNPCGWTGVTCEGGRVTRLDLSMFQVNGPLAPEVGNLSELKYLNIMQGGAEFYPMTGSIPATLGNLQKLEYLEMRGNVFPGTNMEVIGSLTMLTHLAFDTPPSWTIPNSFQNLINLEHLYFGIRGGWAWATMGSVGNIPSFFGSYTKLKTLSMPWSGASGPIPASLNNLTNLTLLDLSNNNLTGPMPDITGISLTATVNISQNRFNLAGMIPNQAVLDVYAPQATIPMDVLNDNISGRSVIRAIHGLVNGTVNTYKFFREGVEVSGGVADGSFSVYWEIRGKYRIEVRNSSFPALVLSTEEVLVEPPLPVTLISFEGKSENNQTKLTWKTAEETNNKGFEIERSIDARNFMKIGFVDGSGDTKEGQHYHFADLNPYKSGYYRLKQLDYDGEFEYSKVIAVKSEAATLKIFPNPAQDYLSVSGIDPNEQLSIIDQNGRIVLKRQVAEREQVRIGKLASGIYTVKIGNQSRKLLIEK